VKALLNLSNTTEDASIIRQIRCRELDQVNEIMELWSVLYDRNYLRIKDENEAAGAETRAKKKVELEAVLATFAEQLCVVKENGCDEQIN